MSWGRLAAGTLLAGAGEGSRDGVQSDQGGWLRLRWKGLGGHISQCPSAVVRVLGIIERAGPYLRKAVRVELAASICHLGAFEAVDAWPSIRDPDLLVLSCPGQGSSGGFHKQAGFRTTRRGS